MNKNNDVKSIIVIIIILLSLAVALYHRLRLLEYAANRGI